MADFAKMTVILGVIHANDQEKYNEKKIYGVFM